MKYPYMNFQKSAKATTGNQTRLQKSAGNIPLLGFFAKKSAKAN